VKVSFVQKSARRSSDAGSVVCVGIDPDPSRMPDAVSGGSMPERVETFCARIIDATASSAAAFKFNFAFFEALGDDGFRVLRRVRKRVPDGIPVIADAKRGDIGNTARFYARSIFADLGFDAVTVSAWMGRDSVLPFLEVPGACTFVLTRTSNPGAEDFQMLESDGLPLYEHAARRAAEWSVSTPGSAGLVVGATDTDALARLRSIAPAMPFLIPGVGAQGGDPAGVMRAAGSGPVLVNSSRSILYASSGTDFEQAAADACERLRRLLNAARAEATAC
jgi:orotidine-5'-phosphate decarboxylase